MERKVGRSLGLLLVVLLTVTSFLTGCGQSSGDPDEPAVKELVIAFDRDAEILDTIKTSWFSDGLIYIHDRLISRDYEFNYRPGLAESWETSEDGLVWTFKLKEGVKFHDGTPLKASDVKFTIESIIDPEVASPSASDLAAIEKVVVKDDLTFDIVLKHPFPNLLFILSNTACGIVSEEAYKKYGDEYGVKYVVGTGPYVFKEWIKGDKLVLEKNPDYNWGPDWMENNGKPIIDRIVMRVIPEESTRRMELEAGNVHILRNVPASFVEELAGNEDIEMIRGDATKLCYLAYACDKEPFTDVRVRRAINHAINKDEIVNYLLRGVGQPAYGYLPPALKSEYYDGSKTDSYGYDVEKAKALLKEAGYENGLQLTLSAENTSEFKKLAEVLQSQLKEVGIETTIQLYDSSSYTDMLKEGKQELFIRLYSWPNADILDYFLLSSQFPYPNHSRWLDEKTDELIKKAAGSATWEERAAGYHEVQKYLIEQAVWAPIYIPDSVLAVRKEVKNFKFHPWIPQYNDGFDLGVE
ncbi:MAG: ABC transporter substrate-binding protein [Dethiobacteraceae bacterium]|jgi:peptide/nickel transport system substrate-binding protein|nr:ABC transporter substrate-binding protein [Bacillota bacterium]